MKEWTAWGDFMYSEIERMNNWIITIGLMSNWVENWNKEYNFWYSNVGFELIRISYSYYEFTKFEWKLYYATDSKSDQYFS